jgi:hypothetical protein
VIGLAPRTASQPLGACTCYLTDPLWASVAVAGSEGAARVVVPGPAPASPCTARRSSRRASCSTWADRPHSSRSARDYGWWSATEDPRRSERGPPAGEPPAHAPAEPRGSGPGSG